ncbi:MAG: DUF1206 domain-containing protein [Ilumatobacter sp.]|nr:DUF1206 domain-containing protein [Ilumatobacter sp.]
MVALDHPPDASPGLADTDSTITDVAERTEDVVASTPWLEYVTRLGWISKGLVYTLMGITALAIARQQSTGESASPEGALQRVMERPGGRALLVVLGAGLLLYVAWRLLTVALIAGTDLSHWLDRLGYTFSAVFYFTLSWTALTAAMRDTPPADGNTIEQLSRTLLETGWTRVLLGVGGLVVIGVGMYFIVRKGALRSFTDDLDDVGERWNSNDHYGRVVLVAGVLGWLGRGVVTVLVGFFVTRAAVRFDASDARGFDRALRQAATTDLGTMLVAGTAVGLIVYGLYCLLSVPRRCLEIER